MMNEKLHPVLYLMGLCLIVDGLIFPFCMAYIGAGPIFFGITICLALLTMFFYYLYIFGEDKKERKKEVDALMKENIFMRCSYYVFVMGILANLCIMISKEYGL